MPLINAPRTPFGRGSPIVLPNALTALMGDSLTTHLLGYNWSPFFWINGLAARGALKLIANSGVSGNTTSQMLARVNNLWSDASPGLAGLGDLALAIVRSGTNDARAAVSAASFASTMAALVDACHTYSSRVILLSVPPIGSPEGSFAAKNALTIQYNTELAAIAAARSAWCTFVDDSRLLRDEDGSQLPGYFGDGIHNNGAATYVEGTTAAGDLAELFDSFNFSSPLTTSAADVYPSEPQYVTNPVMAGSVTVTGSFPGQRASNWSIGNNGSPITGSLSLVAADVGDENQTPWQRIDPTEVFRNGAGQSIRITSALSGPTITDSYPARWDLMMDLRLNAFDTSYFSMVRAWIQGNTGTKISSDLDLKMGGGPITQQLTLRHAMPRIGMSAQASATLYIDLPISASFAGEMGSIDFRCVSARAI